MKGLLLGLLVTAMRASPDFAGAAHAHEWLLNGAAADACELAATGSTTELSGAQLTVSCAGTANVSGNVIAKITAKNLHQHRITLTADVQQRDGMSSTLWLKTSHDTQTLLFDSDAERALLQADDVSNKAHTETWVQRSISLPVAPDATNVSFGMLLQGKGALVLRNVRLTVSSDGPIATEAQQVLDSALAIIKHHTVLRSDIDWRVLEPQARQFAAGATCTADVYPVIRYVLSQLGDRHGLLLTPALSSSLSQRHATSSTAAAQLGITVFTLPDGADLVLSAIAPEIDARIAKRWP